MKYIKVPEPITPRHILSREPFKDPKTGEIETITFAEFLRGRLLNPNFSADAASVVRMAKIDAAIEQAGDVLALEDSDHEMLAKAIKSPAEQARYNPLIAHCLVPFFTAFEEATEAPPKAEEAPDAPAPKEAAAAQ